MDREKIERQFDDAIRDIFYSADKECGHPPRRLRERFAGLGGVDAAKRLLAKNDIPTGFTELWKCGRLDLSVEAHVLQKDYRELFSEEELQTARRRLEKHNFLERLD